MDFGSTLGKTKRLIRKLKCSHIQQLSSHRGLDIHLVVINGGFR